MVAADKAKERIEVHHLTRVEGHGNIVVDWRDGWLTQCQLQVVEAARYFEAMLRGQPYQQVGSLVSRICGICSVAHTTTGLRAVERALAVEPSWQTEQLRHLAYMGELLDSHILHVYMLVAPDLLGVASVIPLASSQPELVLRALRMKKMAGELCTVVAGRHTHPISLTVGGFNQLPTPEALEALSELLIGSRPDVAATVELFQGISWPEFERETEYMALSEPGTYCLAQGSIASSDGGPWPLAEYRAVTNEFLVDHSTAKHARHQRVSYAVGALARFNLNYEHLQPEAKAAAAALGLVPPLHNPYLNTPAQVVEIVHCVEEAIATIERLLDRGIVPEPPALPTRLSGEGVGASEAPRGTLYHHYVFEDGRVTKANCIIPTAQNLANIEADMKQLAQQRADQPVDDLRLALEMLVRAYDPCISCATHLLELPHR